jgi:hypothetical protein
MEQRKRKKSKRSQTKIIPPKKDKMAGLSRDEIRSINKKKIRRKRKFKKFLTLAFLFVVVAGVGLALILTVFFKINTIQITGEKVYSVKDGPSNTGTFVGNKLLGLKEQVRIETGDVITIGATTMIFEELEGE